MNKVSTIISAAALSFAGIAANAENKPNIIVFLVDDMGLMDTSLPFVVDENGNPIEQPLNRWYRTPNMERLAETGIRFSTFYAQSVSSPSRTSLMTGQNATRHRTTNWINSESNNRTPYGPREWNWKGIDSSVFTLPRLLHTQGYKTIHVGKAHFGCIGSEGEFPQNIGFDVNIAGSSIGQPGSYLGEEGYGNIAGYKPRAVPGLEKYHGSETFLTDALTLEAKAEMDKAIAEGKPFYLNMAHYALHAPFMADKRFLSHYEGDASKSDAAKAFATLVEGMDKSLGEIMDYLVEKGVAENTLIIFLGDNGGDSPLGPAREYASSAPLRGKKGTEFEGGMRVPFIISWAKPNAKNKFQKAFPVASGKVQTQMGTIMDVYPTLASLSGAEIPQSHAVDGQNLKPLLQGNSSAERENVFLMHFPHSHRGSYFTVYREGDWKIIYYYNPEHPERPECLIYNHKDDPFEKNELSETNPSKRNEMLKTMIAHLEKEGALYPVDFEGNVVKPDLDYFLSK